MAELFALFGYILFCKIMDEAGVKHNIGPVCANLLTIPINSNELPSGVIGDACNHERKTHNEEKARKEMRENEARQAREDEMIEQHMKKYPYTVEEGLRKAQEIGILLRPDHINSIRIQSYGKELLREKVAYRLSDMIESIKPDADTKRYVDNIDKYREFAALYDGACKNYKDGKITWSECVKLQYALKVKHDNDYWSASDNITRYNYKLLVAYDYGLIYINQYNELQKKLNTTSVYLNTTKKVTVHQKPSIPAPAPVPQPRVENGHVISAQARVNAVNQVASVVSSGATAVGNAYIQGANNIGNYNRMEAQATQQLVSNVATAVGNGATAVGNGFVNPSANSERTNQVLNMVSNAPSAVDLCLSNPRGIGINIVTGMLAEVNNSYNERSTTRNMVNGTIGAVGLVAGVVGAPVTATTIAVAMLGAETLELANNLENDYTRQITNGLNENDTSLMMQAHERGRVGCM